MSAKTKQKRKKSTKDSIPQSVKDLVRHVKKHGMLPELYNAMMEEFLHPPMDIHVLPGGTEPTRMTDGAIGYDCTIRAIVSSTEMDPINPLLRKTVFDFLNPPQKDPLKSLVRLKKKETNLDDDVLEYRLDGGEQVTVGIGVITRVPFPMMYWVAPRSGLSSRYSITISNAPGTVDPDYRGEAGANVRNNGKEPFYLSRGMRIVQLLFGWSLIPCFNKVPTHAELIDTPRGVGGFGHTGV